VFRCDRSDGKHGGVAIYVNNNVYVHRKQLVKGIEHVCVVLSVDGKSLPIVCIYKPPQNDKKGSNPVELKLIDTIRTYKKALPDVIFIGDFNYPDLIWCDESEDDPPFPLLIF